MKQRIRLTESDLHRIVKESVKKVLKEELYYSTNPSLDTTVKRREEFEEKVNTLTRKYYGKLENEIQGMFNQIFEGYYEDSEENDEYFRNNPNASEVWHEQLKVEFRNNIPSLVATHVSQLMFGEMWGNYYYGSSRSNLYTKVCQALTDKFINVPFMHWRDGFLKSVNS